MSNSDVTTQQKTRMSTVAFVFILTIANALIYHLPLANFAFENLDVGSLNGARTLFTLAVIVISVTLILLFTLSLISTTLVKLFAAFAAICSSIAFYFFITYNVILDKTMMGNIFNTRTSQTMDFFTPKMFIYIVVLGLIPAAIILFTKVQKVKRVRAVMYIVGSLTFCLATIYINGSTSLWFDKYSKKLGGLILPWSYTINTARFMSEKYAEPVEYTRLPDPTTSSDKTVVVLIIGETARAANFSLYGYERDTNPLISASDAIALPNARSCSSYTTASIKCMLSHTGTSRGSYEPLPNYLFRNNVNVLWRTITWGEPEVAVSQYVKAPILREICERDHCELDEVLLTGLADQINNSEHDQIFVVLHTKGSHGPSYNTRYPAEMEVFSPVCTSVELSKCSEQELTNAYDNTIIYTDHFLNETIEELKKITDHPTTMLYASDHGESLGEYGLYLHGTPNAIAPAVQLEIPFIVWMSDSFITRHNIQPSQFENEAYSHANIFHSVMGAFGMTSDIYNEEEDIFSN